MQKRDHNTLIQQAQLINHAHVYVEMTEQLNATDLNDLCIAADAAVTAEGGFGWVNPPTYQTMQRYWSGVLAVPERHLMVARVNGIVSGAIQLVEPTRHNEAQAFTANLLAMFVAPWARGNGAAYKLIDMAEKLAIEMNYKVLQLDVRETQEAAVHIFEKSGYKCWGTNPAYALVKGRMIAGKYYTKNVAPLFVPQAI